MKCSICGEELKDWDKYGHNAEPMSRGRCCTKCNETVVIPLRLRIMESEDT